MHLVSRRILTRAIAFTGTLSATFLLSACGGDTAASPNLPSGSRAPLTIQLTDAPFPFDSVARVDVYVVRLDAKQQDADTAEVERDTSEAHDSAGSEHDGWVTVATPKTRFNLLGLQNGKTVDLGSLNIPAGTYRAFRFIINADSSSVTLKDGTVLTSTSTPGIKFPSAGRSGIKVKLRDPVTVSSAGATLVLDFDLSRSFVKRGKTLAEGLLFKPVIRAVDRAASGSISGSVRGDSATGAPIAGATVEVMRATAASGDSSDDDAYGSSATDSLGNFHLAYIRPGTYKLRVEPPEHSGYAETLAPALVTVTAGSDAGGNVIVVQKGASH